MIFPHHDAPSFTFSTWRFSDGQTYGEYSIGDDYRGSWSQWKAKNKVQESAPAIKAQTEEDKWRNCKSQRIFENI